MTMTTFVRGWWLGGILTLGWVIGACDGGVDEAPATASGALEKAPEGPDDEKPDGEFAWAVDFASEKDLAARDAEWACDSEKADVQCNAIDPAQTCFDSVDTAMQIKVCRSYTDRSSCPNTPGICHLEKTCTTCCTTSLGSPVVSCSTVCRPSRTPIFH